ncbi:hypothetical protein LOZ36_006901, partial [Ophidiomyces ophidiicola]
QAVTNKKLNISWIESNNMPADGLTKILPRQKFEKFVKQLRLMDIDYLIEGGLPPTPLSKLQRCVEQKSDDLSDDQISEEEIRES